MTRLALLLSTAALLLLPGPAAAQVQLLDIEDEVMCVTCNVPLNIAESPQADAQRRFITSQIEAGKTKEQIKDALVAQYGKDVLGMPESEGFGITAYAVPAGLIIALVGSVLFLIPRWKHRTGGSRPGAATPSLSTADTRRLDEDLARYDA